MEYPELFNGFATKEHFAWAAGVKLKSLVVMVTNGQLPPLPPPALELTLGGRKVYAESDVEPYRRRVEMFRADAPARAAAKAAERAQRERFEEEQRQRAYAESRRIDGLMREGEQVAQAAEAKRKQDAYDEMVRQSESIRSQGR